MARLAATDYGADWVINTDADEFWWPRGGSLREVLAAVPEQYGIVQGFWRSFVPRPDEGPLGEKDKTLTGDWDFAVRSFNELADRLGIGS